MADGRDVAVWTNHAEEQDVTNPDGHKFNEDYVLRRWLNETKAETCLDYGCGGGLWRYLFLGKQYFGVDQNENMIAHAKKRYPKDADKFSVIQWDKNGIPDGNFDLVFTSAVLQHNRHPDKIKTVQQIVRVLKPGGYFLCTENTFRPDNYHYTFPRVIQWHPELDDGYSFTKMGWEKFMAKQGLKLVHFQEPSEYLFQKV